MPIESMKVYPPMHPSIHSFIRYPPRSGLVYAVSRGIWGGRAEWGKMSVGLVCGGMVEMEMRVHRWSSGLQQRWWWAVSRVVYCPLSLISGG